MLSSFYVLRALAEEWNEALVGGVVESAYSQRASELSIIVDKDGEETTLRVQLSGRLRFVFADRSSGRARRNVADVLPDAHGCTVTGVRVATRDRVLHIELTSGLRLDLVLFGANANVYLVAQGDNVVDRFRTTQHASEQPTVPVPRPARSIEEVSEEIRRQIEAAEMSAETSAQGSDDVRVPTFRWISRTYPLFNSLLARECVHRGDLPDFLDECLAEHPAGLSDVMSQLISTLHQECMHPSPRIYWDGSRPRSVAVAEMRHLNADHEELFDDVAGAVRVFVKRSLAWERFDREYLPIRRTITREVSRVEGRLVKLRQQLEQPSRADEYERWGHVLMAAPHTAVPSGSPGSDVMVRVPDPYGESEFLDIPIRPELGTVENAQRFYQKARAARASREVAESRVDGIQQELAEIRQVAAVVSGATDPESWKAAKSDSANMLEPYLARKERREAAVPYRRFQLDGEFEVWVGRNAKQNDQLTTREARKFDLWLHARGVGGSHVLLRPPNRAANTPEALVLEAAAIAAYYSKARGSALVPVIVAERKYVRKPRRATPGTVLVDRHRVVLVEPALPGRN